MSSRTRRRSVFALALALVLGTPFVLLATAAGDSPAVADEALTDPLDRALASALRKHGFTGRVGQSLEARLGRPVDHRLANLGRLLFFDNLLGLHDDNSCAGCHAPDVGFGDTQSMAVGVDSNRLVGPRRAGPRNQRRAPMLLNNAFYPKLMLNGRFAAVSLDPFDASEGFRFPAPEGLEAFAPGAPGIDHLLVAQAHIPATELPEMAGFTGTAGSLDPLFDVHDNGQGEAVPPAGGDGFRNEPIRQAVLLRLNGTPAYRTRFSASFPEVAAGGDIDFVMVARAIAEFEFTLTFADAPIDRFARGQRGAMSAAEKRGAVLFFGAAGCVGCHTVAGRSNEMFSDFENHVLGVPQLAPLFGAGTGNVLFDGPGGDEDFGLAQLTGDPLDRYKFRTSPLRNLALQPAFFHNGAFTRLEDAVRHHLNPYRSARRYDPAAAGVAPDLHRLGPIEPVLRRLDPLVATPQRLSAQEFADLVAFLRTGLLDPRANRRALCAQLPARVPSGREVITFEGCRP